MPTIERQPGAPVAVGPGRPEDRSVAPRERAAGPDEVRPGVPRVSPLRAEAVAARASAAAVATLPAIEPAEPIATYAEPPDLAAADGDDADDEPPLPDEARAIAAQQSAAPTAQLESQPDQILHVRFGGAAPDRLVLAMETFRALLRERPGGTRVVLHVPGPGGSATLPMELSRRVAYDTELVSEVRRRLGDGVVSLSLG
jgi:hypothetical protein